MEVNEILWKSDLWRGSEIGSQKNTNRKKAGLQKSVYAVIPCACNVTYVSLYVHGGRNVLKTG